MSTNRPYIRFISAQALCVWHSMAEGMAEVAEDNCDAKRAAAMASLIQITGNATLSESTPYPAVVVIPAELREFAEDITENCHDNSSGMKPEDAEAECYIFPGQVTFGELPRQNPPLSPPELTVRESLAVAIRALEKRAMKHDTASPKGWEARAALDTLNRLLAQQGCEHMGDGISGLCEVCDMAIFG